MPEDADEFIVRIQPDGMVTVVAGKPAVPGLLSSQEFWMSGSWMSVAIGAPRGIPSPPMSVYRRALAYYRPYLGRTVVAGALTLLACGFNLLRPWPLAFIVDRVLPAVENGAHGLRLDALISPNPGPAGDGGMIVTWTVILLIACGAMVVFHLLASALGYVINLLTIRASLMSLMTLRTEIYAWLHTLPLKFHDQRRSADSTFRVAYDSQAIQTIYSKTFFIFQSSIALVSTFATIWYFDGQIALLSLAVVPLLILTIRIYAVRIRDESTTIAEKESAVLTIAQDGISSVKMVQAFGREEHELAQFKTSAHASLEANLRFNSLSMRSSVVVGTLIALSTAAMIFVGARHVIDGTLKVGQLWYLSTLLLMLYQPLEALTHVAWALESAAAGAQRCFEVLDRRDDVPDRADAMVLAEVKGAVGFDQVSFGYTSERPILRDIDLNLDPGQTVAFVGGTGAGKSTLLSLVPRFYDPLAGRVLIDGYDVREVTKKSLRRHISIVLQDTLLFSTTIRENIAYGRPGASEAEIVEAAQRAQAHEFIMEMPDGYRSQVGERGGHLSVGQRQRIGIARAFLKNAPVLILDEPTSALDPGTESAIMETLEELMRGRTTLIITHRLATIHHVDQIVVLGQGGIIERGRGPELVALGGVYAQLYRSAAAKER